MAIIVSTNGGNQRASGAQLERRGDERHRVGHGERRHDGRQRQQPPEGDHQAGEEQQVVDAVQDVLEAEGDEAQDRLMPARVEPDQAGVAGVLEGAHGAVRQDEPQHGDGANAEPPERRIEGELRLVRADRVLEQRVEHRLLPEDLRLGRQRGAGHVRQRFLVAGERPVGRQGDAHGAQLLVREPPVVLVHLQLVADPDHQRVAQHAAGGGDVEVARPALGKDEVPHGAQRHAHEEAQPVALRRDDGLHRDVAGNVVRHRPGRRREQQPDHEQRRCERPASVRSKHDQVALMTTSVRSSWRATDPWRRTSRMTASQISLALDSRDCCSTATKRSMPYGASSASAVSTMPSV